MPPSISIAQEIPQYSRCMPLGFQISAIATSVSRFRSSFCESSIQRSQVPHSIPPLISSLQPSKMCIGTIYASPTCKNSWLSLVNPCLPSRNYPIVHASRTALWPYWTVYHHSSDERHSKTAVHTATCRLMTRMLRGLLRNMRPGGNLGLGHGCQRRRRGRRRALQVGTLFVVWSCKGNKRCEYHYSKNHVI